MDKLERRAVHSLLEYDSEEYYVPTFWEQPTPSPKRKPSMLNLAPPKRSLN